jgi:uncharacterized repeat protein (TIGR03803 family)
MKKPRSTRSIWIGAFLLTFTVAPTTAQSEGANTISNFVGKNSTIHQNVTLARKGRSSDTTPKEQVLYTFSGGNDGSNPYAGPIHDSKGNLYGTTVFGGKYGFGYQGFGVAFELSPHSDGRWTETVLHSFNHNGKDGYYPYASLVMDTKGNLFGTTKYGGLDDRGTVFELLPGHNGWTEKVLYSFKVNNDAWNPTGNLIFDAKGNLYGTLSQGLNCTYCGAVFELHPNRAGTWQEMILYAFDTSNNGAYSPYGGLVLDNLGNLYGTTEYGGTYNYGTVFEVQGPDQETVLWSFNPSAGDVFEPINGLAIDKKGRLYGMSPQGGASSAFGGIFEMRRVNGLWHESVIHSFSSMNDGAYPYGTVAIDAFGRLYGTTEDSYLLGFAGIVFQLSRNPQNWQEKILYKFVKPPHGAHPFSSVDLDNAGNIYGTTYDGGTSTGSGVVFVVRP